MAALCRAAAPLLGRWTARDVAGTIEITMQADGTLSGKIVDASRYMRDHNYTNGLLFMRGWRPRGSSSVWSGYATDGEVFVPKQPYYKPDEANGRDSWNRGGVVQVGTSQPLELNLPGSNWFSNSYSFVRAAPSQASTSQGASPGGSAPNSAADGRSPPCFTNSGAIANIGPCTGKVGSALTIRQLRATSSPLARLVFRSVVTNGVPAQVTAPLTGSTSPFSATVPAQLCMAGGPPWEVLLLTASGQNQGVIGRFQPDCRN